MQVTKNQSANQATTTDKPVWFITGCSTGFGHEMAKQLLKHDYKVVITARNTDDLNGFATHDNALILKLDVTDQAQIDAAINTAEATFGRIDVLVNNAGIGYFAAVEEGEESDIHNIFNINVFGISRMIKAVLPNMRRLKKGFIVNLSSIAGLYSIPSLGYYNATKFAVEGLSEALWQEVEPLGIKVMLVEPSGFRTDWAGRSADESKQEITDYAATAGKLRKMLRDVSGKQPGDPVRAVQAIIKAVESPQPPHRLLLGNDAFEAATAKLKTLNAEFLAWESVSRGADYPKYTHLTQ
ncbi:MAG: SDR family NAD(P)-dependent oxidoreductase [Bdellovibrio sp.]|nr:SDR family NAD(P)-dependent oxidoreductase [Methylotenera sp.]